MRSKISLEGFKVLPILSDSDASVVPVSAMLYAAMDRMFVRGRESEVCGYNDWMICPYVKEHKLSPTEVKDRRCVGS